MLTVASTPRLPSALMAESTPSASSTADPDVAMLTETSAALLMMLRRVLLKGKQGW